MFVMGLDSEEIWIWLSICSVCTLRTLIVPWMAHHTFPCTFRSFVTGLVIAPTEIVIGLLVFQPAATGDKTCVNQSTTLSKALFFVLTIITQVNADITVSERNKYPIL